MTDLVKVERNLITFSDDQVDLIKRTIAPDATDDELKLFLYHSQKAGLDPLAKQIYFRKYKNTKTGKASITIITGIDGYRLVADRTGKYAGNDDPVFDNEDNPRKATVTVWKIIGGIRCPFTATARWDQYYPGDYQGQMWRKMPHLMLGKCAEALALRKAFPAELSGMYIKEEMEQAARDEPHPVQTELNRVRENVELAAPTPTEKDLEDIDVPFEGPPAKIPALRTAPNVYDGSSAGYIWLKGEMIKAKIPQKSWLKVHESLIGLNSSEWCNVAAKLASESNHA